MYSLTDEIIIKFCYVLKKNLNFSTLFSVVRCALKDYVLKLGTNVKYYLS